MRKPFVRFLVFILYFSLLILPILDFLIVEESMVVGRGPNVIVRAIITGEMILILLFREVRRAKLNNGIVPSIIFLMFYIVAISLWFSPNMSTVYEIVKIELPLLGFLCFYYLTKRSRLDEKMLSYFFFLLIVIVATIAYLNLGIRINSNRGLTKADNTGYALVCTYAGIMFLTNKKVFPITLFFVIIGTVICGKRGAIIALCLATLPLLKYMFSNRQWSKGKKVVYTILMAVLALVAIRFFSTYFDATIERFQTIEESGGSGRDMVYMNYWNQFKDSNPINQLFGHGLFAGTHSSGNKYAFTYVAAHNDWLELLFDFGVVGTIVYVWVFILMLRILIRNRKNKNKYYYMLVMSFFIWFTKSIFSSTFLMDVNSIYLFMTTAYAIAKLEQQNNEPATIPI